MSEPICTEKTNNLLRSGDDPLHYSLRNYYLWYADSLLTNEEQSSNIFSSNVDEGIFAKLAEKRVLGSDSTLPSAETVLEAAKTSENNQNDEMVTNIYNKYD